MILECHMGAAPDDRAQIHVDYVDYGTPYEGSASDERAQIYVDYGARWGLRQRIDLRYFWITNCGF